MVLFIRWRSWLPRRRSQWVRTRVVWRTPSFLSLWRQSLRSNSPSQRLLWNCWKDWQRWEKLARNEAKGEFTLSWSPRVSVLYYTCTCRLYVPYIAMKEFSQQLSRHNCVYVHKFGQSQLFSLQVCCIIYKNVCIIQKCVSESRHTYLLSRLIIFKKDQCTIGRAQLRTNNYSSDIIFACIFTLSLWSSYLSGNLPACRPTVKSMRGS